MTILIHPCGTRALLAWTGAAGAAGVSGNWSGVPGK